MQTSLTVNFVFLGIIIEEEHHDATDTKIPHRKTTTITLTTAAEAASKANQYKNRGTEII